jgi:hypothetical protein
MKKIALLIIAMLPVIATAQLADTVQLPVIFPPQYTIYIAENGNDLNAGDSLNPVATFTEALNKLNTLTSAQSGEVYTEAVLFEGNYNFALAQPINRYQVGNKNLNVSVRGKGEVILDGNGVSMSGGGGMVHLLGSHISVKNLNITYSPANGVRFGFDYNGTVINPHDIWIDSVEVAQTGGHGIIVGIGELNTANPFTLTPRAERFLISNCHVHDAVNFNTPQSQWGSSIKFHNVKHGTAINCLVHDNSGEGIDADYCDYIEIANNELYDNYANVYLDKAENCIVRNNLIYNINKNNNGMLMGIEPSTGLITDFFIKNIYIYNNIMLNTTGISVWQGTYSAIQNGHFSNINIQHNTIIGKQIANGAAISFSYYTSLGQPGANVLFSNLKIARNIISAHRDSLNNGRLISSSLNPQPALTTEYNLYNMHPTIGYNSTSDRIDSLLPVSIAHTQLEKLVPHRDSNALFVMNAPNDFPFENDFFTSNRFIDSTNVGAIELDTTTYTDSTIVSAMTLSKSEIKIYPNQVSSFINIQMEKEAEITITDISGKMLHKELLNTGNNIINTEALPCGLYLGIIQLKEEKYYFRFVKK